MANVLGKHEAVVAVYPMPEPVVNGVCRYAVVCDGSLPSPRKAIREDVHEIERKSNAIIDVFFFSVANHPPCDPADIIFTRIEPFPYRNDCYDPVNEEDPVNDSKVRLIEQFADAASADPRLTGVIRDCMNSSDAYFHDDLRREHENDWLAYFERYPNDLLNKFLKSRSSHLKEICSSSPILMFYEDWRQYA